MKLSKYTNTVKFEGGVLIHNALHNTAIKIYNPKMIERFEELQNQVTFEILNEDKFLSDLKENYFIIEDWVNEDTTLRYFYDNRSREINLFMIVTRNCNFRCPYCAQEHSVRNMEDKTYKAALDFLFEMLDNKKFDGISVNWFGGEPSLGYEKIVQFMSELKEKKEANEKLKDISITRK